MRFYLPFLLLFPLGCQAPAVFELQDGDRVVFLGDTFFEREARYGVLETGLHRRWPERHFEFRNLGWPADTVTGDARVGYGPGEFKKSRWQRPKTQFDPDYGFNKMVDQVKQEKPSVVFINYGSNEAFGGVEGIDEFKKNYVRLIDAIEALGCRVILITPPLREQESTASTEPGMDNNVLDLYVSGIRSIAKEKQVPIVDLLSFSGMFNHVYVKSEMGALTTNGLHLTEYGYVAVLASLLEASGISAAADCLIHARAVLKDPLRKKVIRKNRWLTYRLRPQNSTYVLYFRRHEMGHIAEELKQFDHFVQQDEEEIARMKILPPAESAEKDGESS